MSRKPYNPATSGPQARIHDRRAREVNRGSMAHIVEVEVDDPYEPGAKIATVRSVRDDPLADHLSRGHIDTAQYMAGREFQRLFGIAERGPRAMQMVEAVDGTPSRESLTDEQLMAWNRLSKCYRRLGVEGSALVHDLLVRAMTVRQITVSRGLAGHEPERYFAKRLWECLNTLAVLYGYA